MTDETAHIARDAAAQDDPHAALSQHLHGDTDWRTRALAAEAEVERLREKLRFYANPDVYKPHPSGPAFDDRDLSFFARAALAEGGPDDR